MAVQAILAGRIRRWACAAILLALAAGAPASPLPAPDVVLQVRRGPEPVLLRPNGPVLRLQAGDRDLRLRPVPPRLRHRYWLEGVDAGWVQPGAGEARLYQALAPGSHRLHVSVADAEGDWSASRDLVLLVEPPWWRSLPALLVASLVALAALAAVIHAVRRRARRRLAWELAMERQRLAERHSRAKSHFLATLGHEIRTPMTGMLGMLELLHGDLAEAGQRDRVEAIQRAGRHLLHLVNDALDLARIEAGKLALAPRDFALAPLLQDVEALLRPMAAAKGLGFALTLGSGVPPALHGDPTRLRQVLINLGHNAIKFSGAGRVSVDVAHEGDAGVRIRIRDTGPGLDAADLARLFEPFEQGEPGEPGGHRGGSGLGLAICRELVVAMGGTIAVHSAPGEGAEFDVSLPLAAADLPAPAPRVDAVAGASLGLLLVEDDTLIAEVVTGLLQRSGHRVEHAAHALAAMAALQTGDYDLALLDLDLPGMDGLALARWLRANGHGLPLLALTARADAEAEPQARAAGMDGFLRKPVSGPALAAAIEAVRSARVSA